MSNYLFSLSLLILFAFSFCRKKQIEIKPVVHEKNGMLINYCGTCGFLIRLNEKDEDGIGLLEPANLSDFPVTLKDSLKVSVSYELTRQATTCMSGKTAVITNLKP